MAANGDELSPVELLAEEFLERQKRGEQPTIGEYCEQHPELATEIREVFEALAMLEELKPASQDGSGTFGTAIQFGGKRLERVGDYRILRELGRGGMGIVYEAEQESLRRRVALKVLPRAVAGDDISLRRFHREARAAARMHHTNIVPVFDVGEDAEHVFYAMQMIRGQGLDHVIDDLKRWRTDHGADAHKAPADDDPAQPQGDKRNSIAASLVSGQFHQRDLAKSARHEAPAEDGAVPAEAAAVAKTTSMHGSDSTSAVLPGKSQLSTAESNRMAYFRSVAEIASQTAHALAYAHARGIIHRDIKPSNLLLDADGVVWVTDFGLAKTSDETMTHTGDILGTIRYMSPERFKGQCDVRADLYSLGLTVYELLVLRPAFESPDRLRLIEMLSSSEPPAPRSLDARIPRDLETIVLKLIEKDPRRRYQSADELADDLERFIQDEPIKARRSSSVERLVRWSRRNKALASLLAAVATLLLLIAVSSIAAARHFQTLNWSLGTTLGELRTEKRKVDDAAQRNMSLAEDNARRANEALAAQAAAETARDALRQQLYISDMQQARLAYQEGSAELLNELLGKYIPIADETDLRGWEWYYWWRANHLHEHQVCSMSDIKGPFREMAIAPDRTWVAARVWYDRIVIFDTATRFIVAELSGANWGSYRTELAVSPDGTVLAAIANGGEVKLWQTGDWSQLPSLHHDLEQEAIAFSPAGMLAAGDAKGRISFWNIDQQSPEREPLETGQALGRLAFSPDGRRLAIAGPDATSPQAGSLRVWDLKDQSAREVLNRRPAITALCWSRLGEKSVLAAGFSNGRVQWWDGSDYSSMHWLTAGGPVMTLDVSQDGSRLAAGTRRNNLVYIWETETGELVTRMQGHSREVCGVVFVDRGRIWSCSNDGSLKAWQVDRSEPFRRLASVAGSDATRRLIFAADGQSLWYQHSWRDLSRGDLESGGVISSEAGDLMAISDNGRFQVVVRRRPSGSATLDVRRTDHGVPVSVSQIELADEMETTAVKQIAISDRGTAVAWAENAQVSWFDLNTGEHKSWNVDGDYNFAQLAISPDGMLVAVPMYWRADLFDVSGDGVLSRAVIPGDGRIYAVSFSPDGKYLATGHWNNDIRIHDTDTGQIAHEFRGHAGSVQALTFSPDSKLLASGGYDGTVRLWDLSSESPGLRLTLLQHDVRLTAVAFARDGQAIATASADGEVLLWSRDTRAGVESNPMYWTWRAKQNEARGDWNAAVEDWTSVIRSAPHIGTYYQRRADACLSLERVPEAVRDLQQALPLLPPSARREVVDEISALVGHEPWKDVSATTQGQWQYTLAEPPGDWHEPSFDDSRWTTGGPRFRNDTTTQGWPQRQIWLRQEIRLMDTPTQPLAFIVNADDVVTIFVNGRKAASAEWVSHWRRYQLVVSEEPLRAGRNVLAVHCENAGGSEAVHVIPGQRAARDRLVPLWSDWLELEPQNPAIWRGRYALNLELQRWQDAAADMEGFISASPVTNSLDWMRAVTLHAMAVITGGGNVDDYRRVCHSMIEQYHADQDRGEVERTLKCCLLLPVDVELDLLPIQRVVQALDDETLDQGQVPWFQLAASLLAYRNTDFADAQHHAEAAFDAAGHTSASDIVRATASALRSLALTALERTAEANTALETARQHLSRAAEQQPDGSFISESLLLNGDLNHDLLIADILLREATAKLDQ